MQEVKVAIQVLQVAPAQMEIPLKLSIKLKPRIMISHRIITAMKQLKTI